MLGGTDAAAIADGLRMGGSVLRPEEVRAILSSDRSADSYQLSADAIRRSRSFFKRR